MTSMSRPRPMRLSGSSVAAVAADPHRSLLGARARELATQRTWAVAVDELETLLRPGAGARAAG